MFIKDQDSIVLALTVVESDITNENKPGFALFSYLFFFFLTAWRTAVSCTPNTSDPSFRGTQTLTCLLTMLVEGLHSPSSANNWTPHELTGAGRSAEAPPRLAAPSSPCGAPCPRAPEAFLQTGCEPRSLHLEQVLWPARRQSPLPWQDCQPEVFVKPQSVMLRSVLDWVSVSPFQCLQRNLYAIFLYFFIKENLAAA